MARILKTDILIHSQLSSKGFYSILSLFKKSSLAKNLSHSSSSFLLLFAKRIQRTNRMRILLIIFFSFLPKEFKEPTVWEFFWFPKQRIQRTNRLRILCPNTKFKELTDVSSIGACRPRIFFINGFLCFLEDEW